MLSLSNPKIRVQAISQGAGIYFHSPELNPDEWIWKNIKHDRVGRAAVRSVEELTDKIERAVDRLQAAPQIVRSFFQDRDLL